MPEHDQVDRQHRPPTRARQGVQVDLVDCGDPATFDQRVRRALKCLLRSFALRNNGCRDLDPGQEINR